MLRIELKTFYMSFASEAGFLGAALVDAPTFTVAVATTHLLGINPGGEVLGGPILGGVTIPARWLNRLLTKADLAELDKELGMDDEPGKHLSEMSEEQYAQVVSGSQRVCQEDNTLQATVKGAKRRLARNRRARQRRRRGESSFYPEKGGHPEYEW